LAIRITTAMLDGERQIVAPARDLDCGAADKSGAPEKTF
jgi:hypothetical protein